MSARWERDASGGLVWFDPLAHKARHAVGAADALSPFDIGAMNPYAPTDGGETQPRIITNGSAAPSSGVAYFRRITLPAKTYSTVKVANTGTAGSVISNAFWGLYDLSYNRLAVSADLSTTWQSGAFTVMSFTFATTVATAGDYYLALLIGGATTMPTIGVISAANSNLPNADGTSAIFAFRNTTASLTALPATATPGWASVLNFWAKFS